MSRTRVGLFGGSFNPIHHGHLILARVVRERLSLDRLIFIPASTPPHKQSEILAPPMNRLEMVRLAIRGEERFEASDCELNRPGPSYTVDTVKSFRERLGQETQLHWIIGGDSLAELDGWRDVSGILRLAQIVTVRRPSWEDSALEALRGNLSGEEIERLANGIVTAPLIDISSTDIRRRVSNGWSIRYLTPPDVVSYIENRGLYLDETRTPYGNSDSGNRPGKNSTS
jgi:nicotinate-nucleotide adenylyltransferase